jgi:chemosensory pili system protein ChpE
MLILILSSFLLGLAYCAPPGVVTAETIRRGMSRGFWPALLVQFGSLIGDTTWALIAVTGLAVLIQNWAARLALSLLGVVFLLYLTWTSFKDAWRGTSLNPVPVSAHGDLMTGAFLSLSNPFAIAFWAGASGSVLGAFAAAPQWYHFAAFFAAFLGGTFLWCFFMAGMVAWGRRFITPVFFRWVNLVCGTAFGFFGLRLGWQALQGFL